MALTETGFRKRTFDEILTDKITKAKELFGEDIDTSELTPLGKYLRINAYDQALTEEEAELIYYSIFPNTAFGTSLDRLCVFAGITRTPATPSYFIVKFIGTAEKVIPAGFLVKTKSNINFATTEDVTIGADGTVEATVKCVESGEIGNVNPTEITVIVNPSVDVDNVAGVSLFTKGAEVESDYDLRVRFNGANAGLGACNEASIASALMRVPTVSHAGVIVNETDEVDAAGRPPRSFECYISGGENYHAEIAEAIFSKKPMGIKTYGSISQDIVDSGGYAHTIYFSHTKTVSVHVRMAIKTSTEFAGAVGKQEIKKKIAAYIDEIGVGNSVIFSSLYGQIHSVIGVQDVVELQLSTDGIDWFASNITTAQYETCVCEQVQIKANDESDYEVV